MFVKAIWPPHSFLIPAFNPPLLSTLLSFHYSFWNPSPSSYFFLLLLHPFLFILFSPFPHSLLPLLHPFFIPSFFHLLPTLFFPSSTLFSFHSYFTFLPTLFFPSPPFLHSILFHLPSHSSPPSPFLHFSFLPTLFFPSSTLSSFHPYFTFLPTLFFPSSTLSSFHPYFTFLSTLFLPSSTLSSFHPYFTFLPLNLFILPFLHPIFIPSFFHLLPTPFFPSFTLSSFHLSFTFFPLPSSPFLFYIFPFILTFIPYHHFLSPFPGFLSHDFLRVPPSTFLPFSFPVSFFLSTFSLRLILSVLFLLSLCPLTYSTIFLFHTFLPISIFSTLHLILIPFLNSILPALLLKSNPTPPKYYF